MRSRRRRAKQADPTAVEQGGTAAPTHLPPRAQTGRPNPIYTRIASRRAPRAPRAPSEAAGASAPWAPRADGETIQGQEAGARPDGQEAPQARSGEVVGSRAARPGVPYRLQMTKHQDLPPAMPRKKAARAWWPVGGGRQARADGHRLPRRSHYGAVLCTIGYTHSRPGRSFNRAPRIIWRPMRKQAPAGDDFFPSKRPAPDGSTSISLGF